MARDLIEASAREMTPFSAKPAAMDDAPTREIRAGLVVAGLFFVLFLGWAAFARLDAAAVALGRVAVSGQRQSVQHRDGGVVGAIFVKEGQKVRKGDVLVRLASAEAQAQERALASQVIGLRAQRARLRSEQLGLAAIPLPVEFATLSDEDKAEAGRAMRVQQMQLRARASLLSTQRNVLGQQGMQVGQQGQGYRRQLASINEQERLIGEELESLRTVAEKGFVSKNRIRALERARADLVGQRGRLEAAISESAASMGESRLRVVETSQGQQDRIATELRDVEYSLGDLGPKWDAARDQVARTELRAPATGTVVGLSVFTIGGVVSPGQKLMDIVPEKSALVVEARFSPDDVDDLKQGQGADVRFPGLHDRDMPPLAGRVERVSADSFADENTGEVFFTGQIVVLPDQMKILRQHRGSDFSLKPGMPVEILVPLRRRSALQYLLDPLTDTIWRSFREA
ncbi:HlyD family type I secretion periplasmic adaptor subunit [Sphingosinicella rhizophila]|uniref:Membrane fusion protein (MFP) family protein n=1 Tax=Sphingosinicella rhizophila TaxID=3050082 RepID=A0ABU3QAF4_9SPHN|nr:HlyD family type I secretion periplasmic adaptor subunit [Sphingosinicella sp. GR2756]MDT9600382.1 HlyD family type I secretion periplasmic adaptor subunit [Sphingosinicella sp. GR2756]